MSSILIVGSGVVGQATGKGFAKKGHKVSFVDVNPERIEELRVAGFAASTMQEVDWSHIDFVMLTVSTPTRDNHIILDYIEAAAKDVGHGLAQANQFITVIVRSTVPPTTTEKRIKPILEAASNKVAGEGFGVAMNPEFLRQVSSEKDFASPWITVLGCEDQQTASQLKKLYAPFGSLTVVCTPTEAEMIKYTNNNYNAVKISYFNEIHAICEQLGIDSSVVASTVSRSAEAMWNPLYGTRGGMPYGGACLPKDTTAFQAFAREQGFTHLMLDATIEVNNLLEKSEQPAVLASALDPAYAVTANGNGNGHHTNGNGTGTLTA